MRCLYCSLELPRNNAKFCNKCGKQIPHAHATLTNVPRGTVYEIRVEIYGIGKDEAGNLVFNESNALKTTLRNYALIQRIQYRGNVKYRLVNKSKNGTLLNGNAITDAEFLKNGDIIQISDLQYRFTIVCQ